MNYAVFIALLIVATKEGGLGADSDFIRCLVVWEPSISGDKLPPFAIRTSAFDEGHYIARAKPLNKYRLGRFEKDIVYTPKDSSSSQNFTEFEILTNPHGCIIKWVSRINVGEHSVPADQSNTSWVGRTVMPDDTVLSGEVTSRTLTIAFEEVISTSLIFEVLQAYSLGLTLEMTDFDFGDTPFPDGKDMLGLDEIYNGGDTEIKQIVTHSKRIMESTSVSTQSSWGHTFKADIGIEIDEPVSENVNISASLKSSYEFQNQEQRNSDAYSMKETTITVTREVIVPAYTSVQICSTISMKDNFILSYVARSKYFAPGLNSDEVTRILAKDGKSGMAEGDAIIVRETGEFSGTIGLSTQFIVVPNDYVGGCSELKSKIESLKRDKALKKVKSLAELKKRQSEIDDFIKNM